MIYTVEFIEDAPVDPTFGPQDPPSQKRITLCEPTGTQGPLMLVVSDKAAIAKAKQGDKVIIQWASILSSM